MRLLILAVDAPAVREWPRAQALAAVRDEQLPTCPWEVSGDSAAAALETVRIQLEDDDAGSRFPLLWRIAHALIEDAVYGWEGAELEAVLGELETVRQELERLPVQKSACVVFGDEGLPETFAREAPDFVPPGRARGRYANLGTYHGPALLALTTACREAQADGRSAALVREGVAVRWLWGAPL